MTNHKYKIIGAEDETGKKKSYGIFPTMAGARAEMKRLKIDNKGWIYRIQLVLV